MSALLWFLAGGWAGACVMAGVFLLVIAARGTPRIDR